MRLPLRLMPPPDARNGADLGKLSSRIRVTPLRGVRVQLVTVMTVPLGESTIEVSTRGADARMGRFRFCRGSWITCWAGMLNVVGRK